MIWRTRAKKGRKCPLESIYAEYHRWSLIHFIYLNLISFLFPSLTVCLEWTIVYQQAIKQGRSFSCPTCPHIPGYPWPPVTTVLSSQSLLFLLLLWHKLIEPFNRNQKVVWRSPETKNWSGYNKRRVSLFPFQKTFHRRRLRHRYLYAMEQEVFSTKSVYVFTL